MGKIKKKTQRYTEEHLKEEKKKSYIESQHIKQRNKTLGPPWQTLPRELGTLSSPCLIPLQASPCSRKQSQFNGL